VRQTDVVLRLNGIMHKEYINSQKKGCKRNNKKCSVERKKAKAIARKKTLKTLTSFL
jgi:hypothetical protein